MIWVLYSRTRFGFEVGVIADSPRAARYAGMRTRRKILAVMALSGAVAGLGGASQIGDFTHTLDGSPSGLQAAAFGYTGIVVAALARYNPFAVCLVAVLIGGLQNAGSFLQGARLPVRARRRDAGDHPVLRARRRAVHPLPRCASRGHARAKRARRSPRDEHQRRLLVFVLAQAVQYGTPLLYAALGELLAERSGVLNLGVEGMMLFGAATGYWATQRVHGVERGRARRRRARRRRRRRGDGRDPRLPHRSRMRASQIVSGSR